MQFFGRDKRQWLVFATICSWCATLSYAQEGASLRIESVVLRALAVAEVPAQQTGVLELIVVGEGELVAEGQLLASLDARQAELAVVKAELETSQAKERANNLVRIQYAAKALEVAKAELQRSRESIEKFAKSISQSQLDVERLTVEKLTLEHQQAEHERTIDQFQLQLKETDLAAARLQLEQHQVRAPFAGVVVLVRGRVGEWIEVGEPLLRLVATKKLRAEGFLAAEEASAAEVGGQVTFVSGSGDQGASVTGVLRFISPEMDPVTRQVRVWAEIDNSSGGLRPGEQGSLLIEHE